ncbi:MAG: hypothetical protein ACYC9O_09690 [Candidatus Latescibacterota bacterium]
MPFTRRSFLKTGAVFTAGLPAFSSGAAPREKVIGCYTGVKEILESPKYIDALQGKLGVNTLLCGEAIRMPDWLREMNPLRKASMFAQHTEDDSALRKAIGETHRRGMRFWLYFSGHHNDPGEREVMSETFDGIKFADLPPIPYALSQGELTTCFEKQKVREYVRALFAFAPREYPVNGMYVSHTRYSTPSFWTNLFGCACPSCRAAADDMGYDFEQMAASMRNLRRGFERLDRKTVEHAARARLSLGEFLSLLGEDNGVADWLFFRARVVGAALRRMHDAVHAATDNRATFVTDTHNPAMSLLAGHNYEDLITGASDGLHPLSWCDYQHVSVIAAWANQLCAWVPGLEESTALRAVTAFFGWDDLGLPDKRIADLRIGRNSEEHGIWSDAAKGFYGYFNPDLTVKLMTREWTRLAAINGGRIPAHPVIKGYEWPEKVCRELMERTEELGLDGYVFQRTETLIDRDRL